MDAKLPIKPEQIRVPINVVQELKAELMPVVALLSEIRDLLKARK
jgi:hypothetical protein